MMTDEQPQDQNPDQIPQAETPWFDGINDRQRRFIEEYCVDFNGKQAAIRAGYSEDSAASIASQNLTKLNVLAAKERYLEQYSMSALEAIKHTTDIARTRLNDYLKEEQVLRTPRVQKHLGQLIDEIKLDITKADEFAVLADLDEKEKLKHVAEQRDRQRRILRYEIELRHDPDAMLEVAGEPVWVDEVRIDMVSLARAKDVGRIKSLSYGEFGPKVEMYGSDSALRSVLEYHGKLGKIQLTGKDGDPIEQKVIHEVTPESAAAFFEIFNKRYK